MSDTYKDPENLEAIINDIQNLNSLKDVNDFINTIYPGWILFFLHKYSHDYPHLQSNWEFSSKKNNTKPAKIMIVDYFQYDNQHELINIFAEIYTLNGFVVRSKDDITPCNKCDCAIPSIDRFNQMKESNVKLNIDKWSNKCSKC